MSKELVLKDFMYDLGKSNLFKATIPLGFSMGLPLVSVVNKQLLVKIPFYRKEHDPGKEITIYYPIRYCLTFRWQSGKCAGFEDLSVMPSFSKLPFDKPIGKSPLKKDGKDGSSKDKTGRLMELYDKMLSYILGEGDFGGDDEKEFGELLNSLIEPSFIPIYGKLDPKFTAKFIRQ